MRTALLILSLVACHTEREAVGVFGYNNIDDDAGNGLRDWSVPTSSDDDVTALVLEARKGSAKALALALSDAENVRVWYQGQVLMDATTPTATVPYDNKAPPLLQFELGAYNLRETLQVVEQSGNGKTLGEPYLLPVRSGPFLLNHHLLPAREVQSVAIVGYTEPMFLRYDELLGDRYHKANGINYGFDVWMQDEIEYGSVHGREGTTGAVIDSIRDRGLDDFAEDEVVGPGMGKIVRGNPDNVTSQDSFGNLEVSPPVTVNGVEYPYGRIYWGESFDRGIDPALAQFLRTYGDQDPFQLDVSWLCVGHVDEFVSFVPDQASEKGFKVAIADTRSAWQILERMDPATQLPKYRDEYGIHTAGQLADDAQLRARNDEIQSLYLDTTKAKLKQELGLDDTDFIFIPDLFDVAPQCFGGHAALIPGMVNLVVDNPRNGPSRIFLADPFIRTNQLDQDSDPFIAEVRRVLPPEHQAVFIDDWEAYHTALGEVHCGTNVIREPHEHPWWPQTERELAEEEG